jgi:hypothetical protein
MAQSQGGKAVSDHIPDATKMISDTPISDSTAHNIADLAMLCRRLERLAAVRLAYIQQLQTDNDSMRADLLLWGDNLRLQQRINRLEEENDALRADLLLWRDTKP